MQFLTQAEAAKKLCPVSRGVFIHGDGGNTKLVGGVNIMPNGTMMACQGPGCALWQNFGTKVTKTSIPCAKHMKGAEMCEQEECEVCDGTGSRILKETVGACGLANLGQSMGIAKIGETLQKLIPGATQ